MKEKNKNKNGSALVVALLILSIILISALSITMIAMQERKASITSSGSNRAYQTADNGIEEVMQEIARGNHDYINNSDSSKSVNNLLDSLTSAGFSCDGGVLHKGNYDVELLDENDVLIPCNDPDTLVSEIKNIKSVGTASSTKRALVGVVLNKITKLLMHFNNDTEDDFLDDSYSNDIYTISKVGSLSNSDADPNVNGTKYVEFPAFPSTKNYLKIEGDGDNFNFLDKDFTIDVWIKPNPIPAITTPIAKTRFTIASQWDGNDRQFIFFYENNSDLNLRKLAFLYHPDGMNVNVNVLTVSDNVNLSTDGQWHHVAVERKNDNIYFFIDGKEKGGTILDSSSKKINDVSDKDIFIGASFNNNTSPSIDSNYQFYGNMDELRITKGVARWTEDFNPWKIEYAPNN